MKVRNMPGPSGLGYARRYVSFAYRPLGMELPRTDLSRTVPAELGARRARLGDFAWDRFPTSILFLTAGAAGFYIGPLIPSPVDTVFKAAALTSIGWGIYYLFKGPATPAEKSKAPKDTPSLSAFQLINGSIVSPVSGTKPSLNFWGEAFDINIAWYNGSSDEVNFTYDVLVDSVVAPGIPFKGQNWISQSVFTSTISVPAKKDIGPLEVTIPVIRPPKPGLVGRGLPPPEIHMYLQLRKFDHKGNPIPVGDSVKVGPFIFA